MIEYKYRYVSTDTYRMNIGRKGREGEYKKGKEERKRTEEEKSIV